MTRIRTIIFLCLMCVSCVKNVKNPDGEALYFVYKFIPPDMTQGLYFWISPQDFLDSLRGNILTPSQYKTLQNIDKHYVVIRLGKEFGQNIIVKNIFYNNRGTVLHIVLEKIKENVRTADIGYPIFVQNIKFTQIIISLDNKVILQTDIINS
ncbi:hypothetical protein SAMN02745150_01246 [Brevinema andersonii]|uniref:Uncharacterized protein n=1 Tax=Brevinema andersonii TaxID=34097 RepID=A0A1I1EYL8_BREAD|nr:hypothetical protein [Brevinema andersonii]SFB90030.1 hypothetical protein SAMN02745150_01246 [Brevinema andersonii]